MNVNVFADFEPLDHKPFRVQHMLLKQDRAKIDEQILVTSNDDCLYMESRDKGDERWQL